MFKLLPDEIWNSSTKFFDPFSKSGIFLKYIDIKLWNHPRLKEEFPDDEE